MSDPTLSDNVYKNKMAWFWTLLKKLKCFKFYIQLFIAIVMLELIVNIKFGFEEFSNANQVLIFQWVIIMLCGSLCGLLICYWSGLIKQKIAPLKYSTFDASGFDSYCDLCESYDYPKTAFE